MFMLLRLHPNPALPLWLSAILSRGNAFALAPECPEVCPHKKGYGSSQRVGKRLRQCPSAAEAEEGEASVCRDAWEVKLASQQGCNGWHQVFRDVMFGQKSPCATVLRTLCIMSLLVNR